MPSLHSLVVRRAAPMDMGTAASSVTAVNSPSKTSSNQKKMDKNSASNKLSGIRLPLLRKESSAINLSLMAADSRSINNRQRSGETPLLRPESSASLEASRGGSWINLAPSALRKCETAVGLSTLALEGGGRAVNRSRVCSRCSSLLSLASSSRYSLAAGSFVPAASSQQQVGRFLCKLCLVDVSVSQTFNLEGCGCSYCKDVRIYLDVCYWELSFWEIYCVVMDAGNLGWKCENRDMLAFVSICCTLYQESLIYKYKYWNLSLRKQPGWISR